MKLRMNEPILSVIVTTLNEEGTIEACIRRVLATYPSQCEVVVVNGGTDRTGEVVQTLCETLPAIRYVFNENDRGKGHAVRLGIEHARGAVMAQIDADLQFLPEELPRLVEPILSGQADLSLGTRFARGSVRLPGSTPLLRTFGNKVVSAYASLLFGHRMTDTLSGMKAWTRKAIESIRLTCDNASYDVELPVKAVRNRLRVIDVPITTDARQAGRSCVNVPVDGLAMLWDVTCFRFGMK